MIASLALAALLPQGPVDISGDSAVPSTAVAGVARPAPTGTGRPLLADGLRAHAAAVVSVRPGPIPPGGNGELVVVIALRGSAVLLPDSRFDLTGTGHGPVRLGAWRRTPARPATLAPAFAGRAAYDDTVTVTVPLGVAEDADYGSHDLALELRAEVHDGISGERLGWFAMPVAAAVTVGASTAAARGPGDDRVGDAPQVSERGGAPAASDAGAAAVPPATDAALPPDPADEPPPGTFAEHLAEDPEPLLIVAITAIVFVLVLLRYRRGARTRATIAGDERCLPPRGDSDRDLPRR